LEIRSIQKNASLKGKLLVQAEEEKKVLKLKAEKLIAKFKENSDSESVDAMDQTVKIVEL
jgi:hypothetical protein